MTNRSERRAWAALVAALFVIAAPQLLFIGRAVGQATVTPANSVVLTSQTSWVGGGGTANPDLHLGLQITAADPSTTTVQVTVYRRLTSRSDFVASLDGKIHTSLTHAFDQVALSKLTTDATGSYQVDIPVNPLVEEPGVGLLSVQVPGVYPVQVTLLNRANRTLAQLTTHLLFTGKAPSIQKALDVALLTPVHAPPAVASDGKPTRLSTAKSSDLSVVAGALAAHPAVAATVAATPETLDALASGSDADRTTLSQLSGIVGGAVDRAVAAPYVAVNVATMSATGLDTELSAQIAQGGAALAADLHVTPATQTWVESGALSPGGIDDLANRGVSQLVVDNASLSPLPAGVTTITLAQPFQIDGARGRVATAISTDPGLQAHFDDGPTQVLSAHQLLADLAIIGQEQPNVGRGVVITIPESWPANSTFLDTMLSGLQGSPVINPVTVGRLFSDVAPLRQGNGTLVRTLADQQPPAPTMSVASAIRAARVALNGLASMAPGQPALTDDPSRLLLIAQSSDLADRRRGAYVAASTTAVNRARGLIHLPQSESITITARTGSVPITLASSAPYTARVRVRLSSQKLSFHRIGVVGGSCEPGGTAENCVIDLRNQNTTLKVPVEARTAGVYPLKIDLVSPDGGLPLATAQYTVRSTAASGVGIVLSVGAALLLMLWWGRDLRHGRRARRLIPAEAPDGGSDPVDDDVDVPWPAPPGTVLTRPPRPVRRSEWITEPIPVISDDLQPPPPSRPPAAVSLVSRSAPVQVQLAPNAALLPPVPPPRRGPGPGPEAKPMDVPASFGRNTAVVAGGTLLSRLTGFGRVLALVWAFHVTRLGDIYNIANTVPNILYDLVLGGVLSATLIPVFVDYLGRDDTEEGWRAISAVCTVIFASLLVLSAVFWLLVPAIIHFYLIFNHTAGAADERAIGTTLLRLFVPQLFLLGGIAVTTALLNARRRFGAAAFSPVVNNLIAIAAIVATRLVATSLGLADFRHDRRALLILGLGTTAGYLVQLIVQVPALMRGSVGLRPVWDLHHPAVRTVLRLSVWTFGAVVANQVAFNLILVLAGRKSGDVVVFTTAYQFFQLPYAIFAVSIAAVVTPDLSERWSKGDVAGFRRQMARGLRLTMAILVPAAVGYVALAHPFLTLIFHHGSFSSSDAHKIGTVVALFAVGLPGFSAYLLLMRAYQAMQDTKSMFWLYVIENAATIALAAILYPILGVGGLALGWVSAYTIGTIAAFAHLRGRTRGLEGAQTATTLVRVGIGSAVMFAAVWALRVAVGGGSDVRLAITVGGGAIVGAAIYIALCRVLGVTELDALLRRRRTRRGAHWAGQRA